jgi:phenylalanyl-tRNA synthetase beta chain
VNVGNPDVSLFEVARVYLPTDGPLPREPWRAAGIMRGGFFDAKGVVEEIYALLHEEPKFESAAHPFMASPACASVPGGWVAQLDPRLLEGEWSAFELDLEELFANVPERVLYRDVITFPAVKEDLAFVVDEHVPAGVLIAAAREAAGPELRDMRAFDVYHGDQVGPGKKSLAFSVTFQSPERTLTDEEAAVLRGRIVEAVGEKFGAELRS